MHTQSCGWATRARTHERLDHHRRWEARPGLDWSSATSAAMLIAVADYAGKQYRSGTSATDILAALVAKRCLFTGVSCSRGDRI